MGYVSFTKIKLIIMSRISIDVSPQEHQKLKAMAALRGVSLKDFLLADVLEATDSKENQAIQELEELLDKRISHHQKTGLKGRSSATKILQSVLEEGL